MLSLFQCYQSLCQQALHSGYDVPSAGHQGVDKTLHRLHHEVYWVNMTADVEKHYRECIQCQQCTAPTPIRTPLMSVVIGRPCQMIAVDILEVQLSFNNNRYLLVVQYYFTKWAEAIPLHDQTALTITAEHVNLFSRFGIPDVLDSDQGRNFESALLKQTLDAFRISKPGPLLIIHKGIVWWNSVTVPSYCFYIEAAEDWERFLPLVLHAYRTSVHSSTGVCPFMLVFGQQVKKTDFGTHDICQPMTPPPIRLKGGLKIVRVVSPTNMQICDGKRTRIVHINQLRQCFQPNAEEDNYPPWEPPQIDHSFIPSTDLSSPSGSCYSTRNRHHPNYYRPQS